jgi:hypothetical protein
MYMGWQQDQPALARGVQFLSETGPDVMSNDVYYNYYATQVLRHYDGPMWTKWNEELREHLIKTQITRDHVLVLALTHSVTGSAAPLSQHRPSKTHTDTSPRQANTKSPFLSFFSALSNQCV